MQGKRDNYMHVSLLWTILQYTQSRSQATLFQQVTETS